MAHINFLRVKKWFATLSLILAVVLLSGTVAFAETGVGYAAHAPVAALGDTIYLLSGMTVYAIDKEAQQADVAFSLSTEDDPVDARHPLLFAWNGHIWSVVSSASSGTVYLRGYAPSSSDKVFEYVLRAWPDHGAFVNGRFYYIAVDPSVSIQAAIYALDLNDGSNYMMESRSTINFVTSGDYLYYAAYELFGNGESGNSVAFASDPPYPAVRLNTATGQIEDLGFGVPFPELFKVGNYLVAMNPTADGAVECIAFNIDSGQSHVFATLTSNGFPALIGNDRYLIIQTSDNVTMTLNVFDATLTSVNAIRMPHAGGVVPVAMNATHVFRTTDNGQATHIDLLPYLE